MHLVKTKTEDLVSSTGQYRWDSRTEWAKRVKESHALESKKTSGWDPYDVWLTRVKRD